MTKTVELAKTIETAVNKRNKELNKALDKVITGLSKVQEEVEKHEKSLVLSRKECFNCTIEEAITKVLNETNGTEGLTVGQITNRLRHLNPFSVRTTLYVLVNADASKVTPRKNRTVRRQYYLRTK